MHPDSIIAGLRLELDRLPRDADDYADRKKSIEAEIKRADGLERPVATAEEPEKAADPNVTYLEGLKRELGRVGAEARAGVLEEIKRVEALIKAERQPAAKPAAKSAEKAEKSDDSEA